MGLSSVSYLHCAATESIYLLLSADAQIQLFHMHPDEMW